MSDKTWKSIERRVAKLLGGERIPVSGRQRGYSPDIQHNVFSIEVKHRQSLPVWLHDAMQQAEMSKHDNLPLVVLHEKGMAIQNSYAVMRLGDLLKLMEKHEPAR